MGRVMGEHASRWSSQSTMPRSTRYVVQVITRSSDADDLSQRRLSGRFERIGTCHRTPISGLELLAIATNAVRNYSGERRGTRWLPLQRRKTMPRPPFGQPGGACSWRGDGRSTRSSRPAHEAAIGPYHAEDAQPRLRAIGESLACSEDSAAPRLPALQKIRRGLDSWPPSIRGPVRWVVAVRRAVRSSRISSLSRRGGAPAAAQAVEAHTAYCPSCRDALQQYRAVRGSWPISGARRSRRGTQRSRASQLESRLADSPPHRQLRALRIAAGAESSVARLGAGRVDGGVSGPGPPPPLASRRLAVSTRSKMPSEVGELRSRPARLPRRPADASSTGRSICGGAGAFQRRVLAATGGFVGTVASYGHITRDIGAPSATRTVAQALRWNPVPIAVPCRRVIGGSGRSPGSAGTRSA